LTVQGLQTGVAVNPDTNYLAAPQTLNADGKILGNYHVVVEKLDSLNSTALTDIQKYVFFQILQTADDDGSIDTSITDGLPEGFYRLTATIHAANHQPVVGPLSQHGAFNDAAYVRSTRFLLSSHLTSIRTVHCHRIRYSR
jgi:negative regulator of sigma E activity